MVKADDYFDPFAVPEEEEIPVEDTAYFTNCSCEHDPAQHSWEKCDECDCEGHWEY